MSKWNCPETLLPGMVLDAWCQNKDVIEDECYRSDGIQRAAWDAESG